MPHKKSLRRSKRRLYAKRSHTKGRGIDGIRHPSKAAMLRVKREMEALRADLLQ